MTVKIEYFSDVLCVWAYSGQIRVDELKRDFADDISIEYRFIPIFGAAKINVDKNWKEKGGMQGFNEHLKKVTAGWDHIALSSELWTKVAPNSSGSCHLYLKAIQLLAEKGVISNVDEDRFDGRTLFEYTVWAMREAFFSQGKDISVRHVQDEVAGSLGLPLDKIASLIDSGEAHAACYLDIEAQQKYSVPGSPTLVLNEGRQMLYGNLGYRILDANVRELLHHPENGEAKWC